jgi:aerobic carbon-monoxide dehydrogenase large subunit
MSGTTGLRGAAGRFVGERIKRREDPRLLTGHGQYVDDIVLPGMLHAAFVRSPLARAKVLSIDAAEALALPGVHAVWTGADINGDVKPMPLAIQTESGALFPQMHPLADGDVRFVGDPVAIVVAETRYIAEDACELVEVDYEPEDAVVDYISAVDAPPVHADLETNVAWSGASPEDPELDAAFAAADHVIERTVTQQRQSNVPMEPRGLVARWEPFSEELTVYLSSQSPHEARIYLADLLVLPEHQVRVIMRDVGGGFGQKFSIARDEAATVIAARRLGVPVKWIEDRYENLIASNHAREESFHVKAAVMNDGTITAWQVRHHDSLGAYPLNPIEVNAFLSTLVFPGPYKTPKYGFEALTTYTNTAARGAYRGPWMMETVARETVIDVIAHDLGLDPADVRRRNLVRLEDQPFQTPMQLQYERITPGETYEQALELIDYEAFRAEQARAREQGRYLGVGTATYVEPTAMGIGSLGVEVATIRVEPTGKVNVLMGTASHGHSLETTMIQVVAEHLGVAIEDVVLKQGDTAISPYGGGTGGSRSAVIAGGVARISALKLREKVLEIAAHQMEIAPEDLEMEAGVISPRGVPERSMTLGEVAQIAYVLADKLPEGMEPGLENTSRYKAPMFTFSNASHACTCEVDPGTGEVKLLDYVVSEDCGVMINPMVVEGQIAGGVVQGIGGALLENAAYGADGTPLAATFKDYLLPTADMIPEIRYGHIETPSDTPGGHKGMGEGGAIAAPPAVVNAVLDALRPFGVRAGDQPLTPDRVRALIREAQGDAV